MLVDPSRAREPEQPDRLVQALRALPLESPPEAAWPALAVALQQRQRAPGRAAARSPGRRRKGWWLAAAALLAVVLILPYRSAQLPGPDALLAASAGDETNAALIVHSQWLERLVDAPMLDPGAQDADQLLLELGLRERIGSIDAALATAAGTEAQALWQARVGTLSQLAQVRWAGQQSAWLVAAGQGDPEASTVLWSN